MSEPVVRVVSVSKTFIQQGAFPWSPERPIHAVKSVDIEIHEGEIIALVGQSGSGKTTLARLVLGLEEITSGQILLEGRRWDTMTERERYPHRVRYQYVPQDAMSALDPQQSALEHVVETLRVLGGLDSAEAERQAIAMLERLGLGHRLAALPRQMSGGEQRRVTLARVLALRPRLVVADEPTSGLEPDRREEVLRDLIGNLPKDAGCILVTHDMSAARKWATRVLVMLDGHIIEKLDLREEDPVHPYARMLFDPWSSRLPDRGLAPTGCAFRLDCPQCVPPVAERCVATVPSLQRLDDTHSVACHAAAPQDPREDS
ncbi:MAG: ABC transporter ATP-binding protein [Alphaproteobacteria bacterium]|nr:ABC transporter ATP-binding protein [Alphaproteobacteria bacterium]